MRGYEAATTADSMSEDSEDDDEEDRGRSREKGEGSVVRAEGPERDFKSTDEGKDPFDDVNAENRTDDPEAMALDEDDLLKIDLDESKDLQVDGEG